MQETYHRSNTNSILTHCFNSVFLMAKSKNNINDKIVIQNHISVYFLTHRRYIFY
jgi:hypothetical protein